MNMNFLCELGRATHRLPRPFVSRKLDDVMRTEPPEKSVDVRQADEQVFREDIFFPLRLPLEQLIAIHGRSCSEFRYLGDDEVEVLQADPVSRWQFRENVDRVVGEQEIDVGVHADGLKCLDNFGRKGRYAVLEAHFVLSVEANRVVRGGMMAGRKRRTSFLIRTLPDATQPLLRTYMCG